MNRDDLRSARHPHVLLTLAIGLSAGSLAGCRSNNPVYGLQVEASGGGGRGGAGGAGGVEGRGSGGQGPVGSGGAGGAVPPSSDANPGSEAGRGGQGGSPPADTAPALDLLYAPDVVVMDAPTLPRLDASPDWMPTANGLQGEYFEGQLGKPLRTIPNQTINFAWVGSSPGAGIPADNFSARWTGYLQPQYSEAYRFHVQVDDGVLLWVNHKLLIDEWHSQTEGEYTSNTTVDLQAGQFYWVEMHYFEGARTATARLSWSSASQPEQPIPYSRLWMP